MDQIGVHKFYQLAKTEMNELSARMDLLEKLALNPGLRYECEEEISPPLSPPPNVYLELLNKRQSNNQTTDLYPDPDPLLHKGQQNNRTTNLTLRILSTLMEDINDHLHVMKTSVEAIEERVGLTYNVAPATKAAAGRKSQAYAYWDDASDRL